MISMKTGVSTSMLMSLSVFSLASGNQKDENDTYILTEPERTMEETKQVYSEIPQVRYHPSGFGTHYFVSIPPIDGAKYREANYTIWIPNGVKEIRAIIMHQHGCGEGAENSGGTATFDVHWQALARKWDCAFMGSMYRQDRECMDWCLPGNGSEGAFLKAIAAFSKDTGHPELISVPWVLWGHSGGSTWAYHMFIKHHHRIIAVVLRSGPPIEALINLDSLNTPMIFNLGVKEKSDNFAHIWLKAEEVYKARRSEGAYATWAPDPESSHDCRFSRLLVIPYLDACLEQRLPETGADTLAIKPIDTSLVWLGNVNTFEIAPVEAYKGDKLSATWLPDESIARKWQEFVKTGWVTDTTPPPPPENLTAANVNVNSVELKWNARADLESGIKTFYIYRDGEKIGVYQGPSDDNGNPRRHFQKPTYHDNVERPFAEMKYIDDNLKPGAKYVYQVSTVNWSDMESPRSVPLAVKTAKQ